MSPSQGKLILDLPNELLERILFHLDGVDAYALSLTCVRLYNLVGIASYWSRAIARDRITISDKFFHIISQNRETLETGNPEEETETSRELRIAKPAREKYEYIVGRRVEKNIARANYREGMIQHFHPDNVRIGYSDKYLVTLESLRVRAWEISGSWVNLLYTKSTNIDLENPVTNVYQILVVKSTALVCYTFGESPSAADFQTIEAFDVAKEWTPLWNETGLLGPMYHMIRKFGEKVFKLDFLRDTIDICDVTESGLISMVVLSQPRHSMRIPFGEISASDKYLIVPGKLVPENFPVVACWNTTTKERQLLSSDRPVCPFRWFERTAVSGNTVYGLLNRFRLMAWNADSAEVVFSIDLTDASPGDEYESKSWLEVSGRFILSVHQEKHYVTVLSTCGIHLGSIRPLLEDWCYAPEADTYIEEVAVRGYTAVLRLVSRTEDFQNCCQIVTADLTPFLDVLEKRLKGSTEATSLIAHVSAQHCERSQADHCYLLFNDVKIFDIQPLGIKFYDYLFLGERFPDRQKCQH